jgi:hypothetical protein
MAFAFRQIAVRLLENANARQTLGEETRSRWYWHELSGSDGDPANYRDIRTPP